MADRVAHTWQIRVGTPTDLPGIFAIYDQHVLRGIATAQTVPHTAAEREEWLARHEPGRYPLLVALDDAGAVAGWAGLSAWSPRQAYARTAESSVYIADAWHGKGLGRRLMEELLARAVRQTPVRVVIARVVNSIPNSIALHERLGFRTVGVLERVMEKFGALHDVRVMQRDLI